MLDPIWDTNRNAAFQPYGMNISIIGRYNDTIARITCCDTKKLAFMQISLKNSIYQKKKKKLLFKIKINENYRKNPRNLKLLREFNQNIKIKVSIS